VPAAAIVFAFGEVREARSAEIMPAAPAAVLRILNDPTWRAVRRRRRRGLAEGRGRLRIRSDRERELVTTTQAVVAGIGLVGPARGFEKNLGIANRSDWPDQ
jgi:hypothetical protein